MRRHNNRKLRRYWLRLKSLQERALFAAAAFGVAFVVGTFVGYFQAPSRQSQARLALRQAVAVGVINGRCTILVELDDGRLLSYDPGEGAQTEISLDDSGDVIRRLPLGQILDHNHHAVPWTGSDTGAWKKYADVLTWFNPAAKGVRSEIASTVGTLFGVKLGASFATRVNQDSPEFTALLGFAEEWRHLERDVWLLLTLHAIHRPIHNIWDIEDLRLLRLADEKSFNPTPEQFCRFVNLVLDEQDYRSDLFNQDLRDILEEIKAMDRSQ